jgi:hypothetical protein
MWLMGDEWLLNALPALHVEPEDIQNVADYLELKRRDVAFAHLIDDDRWQFRRNMNSWTAARVTGRANVIDWSYDLVCQYPDWQIEKLSKQLGLTGIPNFEPKAREGSMVAFPQEMQALIRENYRWWLP